MSNTLFNISVEQLQRALSIREQIESLQEELTRILGGEMPLSFSIPGKRYKMSVAGRRAIAAAQKARWAKLKRTKPTVNRRRKMSATAKAKIAAAARARWKKAKAAGRNAL